MANTVDLSTGSLKISFANSTETANFDAGSPKAIARNEPHYYLMPDQQADAMKERIEIMEEYARSPDANFLQFKKEYEAGRSELENLNASPEDISALTDSFEKYVATIELPSSLIEDAITEGLEIQADLELLYTLREANSLQLTTEELSPDEEKQALDTLNSQNETLIGLVEDAQTISQITGIPIALSDNIIDTYQSAMEKQQEIMQQELRRLISGDNNNQSTYYPSVDASKPFAFE